MINKKKSVGIILIGKTAGELMAILQVRGVWNQEKNAPESYAGACQVTVHGKLEEGEDFMQALWLEMTEELGAEVLPAIKALRLIELVKNDSEEQQIIT